MWSHLAVLQASKTSKEPPTSSKQTTQLQNRETNQTHPPRNITNTFSTQTHHLQRPNRFRERRGLLRDPLRPAGRRAVAARGVAGGEHHGEAPRGDKKTNREASKQCPRAPRIFPFFLFFSPFFSFFFFLFFFLFFSYYFFFLKGGISKRVKAFAVLAAFFIHPICFFCWAVRTNRVGCSFRFVPIPKRVAAKQGERRAGVCQDAPRAFRRFAVSLETNPRVPLSGFAGSRVDFRLCCFFVSSLFLHFDNYGFGFCLERDSDGGCPMVFGGFYRVCFLAFLYVLSCF